MQIKHPPTSGHLCLIIQNWLSLLIIFTCACAVQLWRIHVEEKVLAEGLGDSYRNYSQRTRRLIPFIY